MDMLERFSKDGVTLVGNRAGRVRFGFTERTGGISLPPYASLNLGSHVGDDPDAVAENRRRALATLDCADAFDRLLVPNQVHGVHIARVRTSSPDELACVRDEIARGADAIVCTAPGVPVLLCFADCVPVILTCETGFAVVHSGWKGTIARIVVSAVRALAEESGCESSEIRAFVGPHILGDEYEVSPELMERFAGEFTCMREAAGAGSRLLDLGACIREAMGEAGVPSEHVEDPLLSTMKLADRFYSYRREAGTCGRHGALAILA